MDLMGRDEGLAVLSRRDRRSIAVHQPHQPPECHADLFEARGEPAGLDDEHREAIQAGGEEGEVADREGVVADRIGDQHEDEPGAERAGLLAHRVEHLIERSVAHHRVLPAPGQPVDVRCHVRVGAGDLDRLHGAQDLVERTAEAGGGCAADLPVALGVVGHRPRDQDHDGERDQREQRDPGIDRDHQAQRHERIRHDRDLVGQPADRHLHLADVIADGVERLARRPGDGARAGLAQDARQQVPAQERADRELAARADDGAGADGDDVGHARDEHQDHDARDAEPVGLVARERVEEELGHDARRQLSDVDHDPDREEGHREPGTVGDQAPEHLAGAEHGFCRRES